MKLLPYLPLIRGIISSNLRKGTMPYKITLSVTNRCNSRCRTCNIWKHAGGEELSVGEISRVFSGKSFPWINLTGGEPFIRDDLAHIAGVIRDGANPYIMNITTNGQLTDRILDTVREIISLDIPRLVVVVSIDGPERVHDQIRGVKGSWRRAVNTHRRLTELSESARLKVFIGYTFSEYNQGLLPDTWEALRGEIPGIKRSSFHFNIFHASPHFYMNKGNKSVPGGFVIKEMNDFIDGNGQRISSEGILESQYRKRICDYLMDGRVSIACKSLSSSCFISPEGDIYPCIHFDRKIGNLRGNGYDLVSLLSSSKTSAIRDDIKRGFCPGCWTPCEAYQTILGNLRRWRFMQASTRSPPSIFPEEVVPTGCR